MIKSLLLFLFSITIAFADEFLGMDISVAEKIASKIGLIFIIVLTLFGVIAIAIGIKKLTFEEKGQSQENNHVRGISFIAGGALWIVLMVFIGWVTGVNITIDE
mgnify:FL=1